MGRGGKDVTASPVDAEEQRKAVGFCGVKFGAAGRIGDLLGDAMRLHSPICQRSSRIEQPVLTGRLDVKSSPAGFKFNAAGSTKT